MASFHLADMTKRTEGIRERQRGAGVLQPYANRMNHSPPDQHVYRLSNLGSLSPAYSAAYFAAQ